MEFLKRASKQIVVSKKTAVEIAVILDCAGQSAASIAKEKKPVARVVGLVTRIPPVRELEIG